MRLDVFEKLPVPYGLVRYGVAPDHPEVRQSDPHTSWLWAAPLEARSLSLSLSLCVCVCVFR